MSQSNHRKTTARNIRSLNARIKLAQRAIEKMHVLDPKFFPARYELNILKVKKEIALSRLANIGRNYGYGKTFRVDINPTNKPII